MSKTTLFKNFVLLQRGFDLPNPNRKSGTIPVVASTGISGYHNEYKVNAPGVVTGRSGSLGIVQYITDNFWPLNTSLWVKDFKGNSPRYVYYYLQTMRLENYNSGAGVPTLNRNDLDVVEVDIHEQQDQHKIISILSAYDNLIENNNRRISILEEMAQKLYREWFVHFRFPGHENVKMVESEMGLIPEGWEVRTAARMGQIVGGGTPSTKNETYFTKKGIPWLCPRDFSKNEAKYIARGQTDISEEGYKASGAKMMPAGAVVFSSRAPIGYTAIAVNPLCTNQGFKSIVPNDGISSEYIYYYLKNNLTLIDGYSSGATFKEISSAQMKLIPFLAPDSRIMAEFDGIAATIGRQVYNLQKKNINLRKTRDLLLPHLISGDIDVSDLDIPIKEG